MQLSSQLIGSLSHALWSSCSMTYMPTSVGCLSIQAGTKRSSNWKGLVGSTLMLKQLNGSRSLKFCRQRIEQMKSLLNSVQVAAYEFDLPRLSIRLP